MFIVNHLYRGRADRRHEQATLLNEWVADQDQPVIAVGDYKFDWQVDDGYNDHDLGYGNMTKGDEFTWVRPSSPAKTQKSPSFSSVLDFVFASNSAIPFAGTQSSSSAMQIPRMTVTRSIVDLWHASSPRRLRKISMSTS